MTYVLIILFVLASPSMRSNGTTFTSVEFASKEACEAAGAAFAQQVFDKTFSHQYTGGTLIYVCVQK